MQFFRVTPGVLMNVSNIYDKAYVKIVTIRSIAAKKLHHRCLTGF